MNDILRYIKNQPVEIEHIIYDYLHQLINHKVKIKSILLIKLDYTIEYYNINSELNIYMKIISTSEYRTFIKVIDGEIIQSETIYPKLNKTILKYYIFQRKRLRIPIETIIYY